MNLFGLITGQVSFVNLPLFAVSLTALPVPNTPQLLMLHWHGFRKACPAIGTARDMRLESVPGSALQLNDSWDTLKTLDEAMLDAAWRLGAWDLDRTEKRACADVAAQSQEELECCQAFASHPDMPDHALLSEAPDLAEMLELGSRIGYVQWKFRPVHGGIWPNTVVDETLTQEGCRHPPCPVAAIDPVGTRRSRTRYKLGHTSKLFLP